MPTRIANEAPMQELDGHGHSFSELDGQGKLNQESRPPAELPS